MTTPLRIELSVTVALQADSLEVTLMLANRMASGVAIFNRIATFAPDGTMSVTPSTAFVELQDDRLIVRKALLISPAGARAIPIFASIIDAGGTYDEVISLQLPVRVMSPKKRAALGMVAVDSQATARHLILEIGAMTIDDSIHLLPEHPAFPDALTAYPPELAIERQQILTERRALSAPIPVLNYRVVK
jgi:hypothetical protein